MQCVFIYACIYIYIYMPASNQYHMQIGVLRGGGRRSWRALKWGAHSADRFASIFSLQSIRQIHRRPPWRRPAEQEGPEGSHLPCRPPPCCSMKRIEAVHVAWTRKGGIPQLPRPQVALLGNPGRPLQPLLICQGTKLRPRSYADIEKPPHLVGKHFHLTHSQIDNPP